MTVHSSRLELVHRRKNLFDEELKSEQRDVTKTGEDYAGQYSHAGDGRL